MITETHGTSTTIANNSRSNSQASDLINTLFPRPGASYAPSLQANNKFKEAVLSEAAREKDEQKVAERVKKEEERLNKIKSNYQERKGDRSIEKAQPKLHPKTFGRREKSKRI